MAYTDIDKPSDYFNTVLYSGTDSAQSVTGVGFQPDWTWIKCRSHGGSASFEHVLTDAVRGANKTLTSDSTEAEATNNATGYLNIFDSDGFTTASGGTSIDAVGGIGRTYVAWNWLASNSTASNTDGSITSTVSANTTSGFSIVSYTGNGTSGATVGHGLGVAPSMIIEKGRSVTDDWLIYHKSLGATYGLALNNTTAAAASTGYWNDTAPTPSLFTIGNNGKVNTNGGTHIAYCFAEKPGYSKFGSYTGNGSTDGTFVYTGFKPAFVIGKRSSAVEDWFLFDSTRDTYNVNNKLLYPNGTNAEYTGVSARNDFLSNGFKMRIIDNKENGSGSTYIYMAFAEEPFVTSTGIPGTAR